MVTLMSRLLKNDPQPEEEEKEEIGAERPEDINLDVIDELGGVPLPGV
jgi:hypothetical protein